ncbi:PhzF family phenazine biosynthesis protein [Sphingomonas colocasiae]|uniref:PhzF family phenazine biosynthesis protein n=1 Tax=Sphingomonas colocasiae TaxID=1848973 RepID=A0ABS7PKK6_9SPHN|nr:PhzF family phenazine biosynthesis protein [Sphingomonas colocasiae]MBY8821776.1 PhzF family phenazine biosynthesis protein [Sphingomonas colocasiae]
MAEFDYLTIDVFTKRRFGGNPLAVFPKAEGLDTATMQALAAELNYSETTFVLPPEDSANTARVRIFNRTAEMPFAGHPNVGTAYVLARHGHAHGQTLRFEEVAGLVDVRLIEENGAPVGAEIDAPQPLSLLGELPVDGIAQCLSLPADAIMLAEHPPVRASVGVDFVLVQVRPEALGAAVPDLAAYRRLAAATVEPGGRLSIFLYAVEGSGIRARMFAPLAGTWEDPATGSANAALAALRLSIKGGEVLDYDAVQGVEMGRESHLSLRAWRAPDGIRASVGGRCVDMFSGKVIL